MLRSRLLSEAQVRTVVRSTRHLSMYTLAVGAKLGGGTYAGAMVLCMVVHEDACLVSRQSASCRFGARAIFCANTRTATPKLEASLLPHGWGHARARGAVEGT